MLGNWLAGKAIICCGGPCHRAEQDQVLPSKKLGMWSVVGPGMDIGIVAFLRAGWIAGTLPILIALVPSSWFNSLHDAILGLAKRGKIMQSSPNKLTVPQRFFFHFYVVAVVWTTFLVAATWFYAYQIAPLVSEPLLYPTITTHLTGGSQIFSLHRSQSTAARESYQIWQSVLLLLLMEVQVLRRLVETIYIFKYSPKARMHIFGYLTGLFTPVVVL